LSEAKFIQQTLFTSPWTTVGAWMRLSIDWWFSRIPRPQGMLIAT